MHPAGCQRGDLSQRQGRGLAELQGLRLYPLLAYRDNTGEPLAGLRPGSAGSNTAADHLSVLDAAIAAVPPAFRGG